MSARAVKVGEIEYRIVCSHGSHSWPMKDRAAAEEAAARHADLPNRPGCAPWTVEARAVSEWGDPDATELCLYAMGKTLEGRLL